MHEEQFLFSWIVGIERGDGSEGAIRPFRVGGYSEPRVPKSERSERVRFPTALV